MHGALRAVAVAAPALNEGRSRNPGDTRAGRGRRPSGSTLNEGRSLNSGDTRQSGPWAICTTSLNEGRSPHARRHMRPYGDPSLSFRAQRRPEPKSRRHDSFPVACASRTAPLNEGRSRNPGDTSSSRSSSVKWCASAQRRPEPKPRRHPGCSRIRAPDAGTLNEGRSRDPGDTRALAVNVHRHSVRSTKAGVCTAATPCDVPARTATLRLAQRRPEPQLRRHMRRFYRPHPLTAWRSTKAGAETPATR